jgi:hypothetical protein
MKTAELKTLQRLGTSLLIGSVLVGCNLAAEAADKKSTRPETLLPEVSSSSGLLSPGNLRTSGNQIVNSTGRPQRLACAGYNEHSKDLAGDLSGKQLDISSQLRCGSP